MRRRTSRVTTTIGRGRRGAGARVGQRGFRGFAGVRATGAALAVVLLGGTIAAGDAAASPPTLTWTCTMTATACVWTVPTDIYGSATITVDGAQGGSIGGSEVGGDGAVVSGTYTLTAGVTVTADVGSAGSGPTYSAPYSYGGAGGTGPSGSLAGLSGGAGGLSQYSGGGGGGAASALYVGGTLLMVAGGGGGAGGEGVNDPTPVSTGGEGGTPFSGGGDGTAGGGCGASQGAGGGSNGNGGTASPGVRPVTEWAPPPARAAGAGAPVAAEVEARRPTPTATVTPAAEVAEEAAALALVAALVPPPGADRPAAAEPGAATSRPA